jgi:hypothetical protein
MKNKFNYSKNSLKNMPCFFKCIQNKDCVTTYVIVNCVALYAVAPVLWSGEQISGVTAQPSLHLLVYQASSLQTSGVHKLNVEHDYIYVDKSNVTIRSSLCVYCKGSSQLVSYWVCGVLQFSYSLSLSCALRGGVSNKRTLHSCL